MKKTLISIIILTFLLTLTPASFGAPASQRTLQGNIEGLNYKENTITLLDYNGKRHNVKILPSTTIEIEGTKKDIYHLYFGQEVDIILEKNTAKKVIGYPEEDPERDGYIMAGSRFRMGDVLFLSQNSIEIKVKDTREKYRITPYTTVIRNGEITSLNQVKPGDKVELTFDDIYSTEVSTLRVQDEEKHIKGIIKGKIHSVDERKKEVYIKTPYIYKEGIGWTPYEKHIITLKVQGNPLYYEGQKINLKELNKLKNKETYIAYDTAFGNLNIAKLQVKEGPSRIYEATVEDIEYGTKKMVVDRTLINFNPGTIVVKNNRLVDILNIDRKQDVFINTDMVKGTPMANFVSIGGTSILDDRIDGSKIAIYRGKIEDIYQYKVKIGKINYRLDRLKLTENNKWKELKTSETFDLTEDTLIYDSQLKEYIPASYFISSRYINLKDIKDSTLRKRVEDNFYKNRTAYFIVKESTFGKELLALNLTPHISIYRQNVNMDYSTLGEIKEIDYDNNTITFTKVKNFNTLNNRWENTSDETVDIKEGVILLNDLPIPKDKLYVLRKGTKAYIIKNKQSSKDKGYVILIED
ncbi:hypothetical protein [Clostridium sp. Cult2]|uniref:hypothetical protein n=1 Tax=Clostridium sp. Cult2 TaxID=2079003 RepID=UPI001F3AAC03|nr:hypothetical protein [Clostridium sp. Cult2]MCF6464771.1 hypothetical protein [Clostridium sp. Cult2]